MKRKHKPLQTITLECEDCGQSYLGKTKKPCNDGKFRCKSCKGKRNTKRFEDKHGATLYEKYGTQPKYKNLRRKWQLKHKYKLTPEDYKKMLDMQENVCAICKRGPREHPNLAVDHDHTTGAVRGLLCQSCNRAIGVFKDNLGTLRGAISYLLKYTPKRSWDHYFMDLAKFASTRSKDPSTQVGAVIVLDRNILSTGYNGFPRGVNDNILERYERPEKYMWTVHAEENAILNASRNGTALKGASLYVTPMPPCTNCAKAIIQSGIKEVVVEETIKNLRWLEDFEKAKMIFEAAKILVRYPE